MMTDALRDRARELIATAREIVVLTGAGVSAESGVPTFRGPDGLWKSFRPEELATPEAFARDPRLVWEWYAWRRKLVLGCAPNAAHRALADLALRRGGVRIITQNVDELHGRAARDVANERDPGPALPLELHGSILRSRCTACGGRSYDDTVLEERKLPSCSSCGATLRPDVVWFGESLEPRVLADAIRCASRADLCLVIGTSAIVHPAAGLATMVADRGGKVIEVNPDATVISRDAEISIRGTAVEVVPELVGG